MCAADDAVGVVPRAARYLFARMAEQADKTTMSVTYCEVYNEQVRYCHARGLLLSNGFTVLVVLSKLHLLVSLYACSLGVAVCV